MMPTVTDADREAVKAYLRSFMLPDGGLIMDIDEGRAEKHPLVQAFARHRESAIEQPNTQSGEGRPMELTPDMQGAGELAFLKVRAWASHNAIPAIWSAMLAATPPASEQHHD